MPGIAAVEGGGLYGIAQSGLSLFLRVQRNQRTDAMLFFKQTKSMKDFRKSFQLCALQYS